ncbi:biotin holocarboxylase synthetase [Entomophthora muscae]|uniref:Biotin holocarboxylase synthetase n=1 Tax=Entomophthora muscae TaxID=34485 RepID=A0ACC2SRZ5_9FUNG|nr:biotin holocarboxylase synthetase [Entomophthora muscae]
MVSAANVLVYAGDGAKPEFVNDTISTFQRLLSEACHVKRVYASELKHCGWLHTTDMLIIPGGRATPYATDLKGRANTNIINYVKRGGVYIGLALITLHKGMSLKRATQTRKSFVTCHLGSILEYVGAQSSLVLNTTLLKAQSLPISMHKGHIQCITMEVVLSSTLISTPIPKSLPATRRLKIHHQTLLSF